MVSNHKVWTKNVDYTINDLLTKKLKIEINIIKEMRKKVIKTTYVRFWFFNRQQKIFYSDNV